MLSIVRMNSKCAIYQLCSALLLGTHLVYAPPSCPIFKEGNKITLRNQSGTIASGLYTNYKGNDKCTWELYPPSDDAYTLLLNVTSSPCKDKFKIQKTSYCRTEPFTLNLVKQSMQTSCKTCGCQTFDKYPLKIEFSRDDNGGFSLNYEFSLCTKTTASPTADTSASTTKISSTSSNAPMRENYAQNNSHTSTVPVLTGGETNSLSKETSYPDSVTGETSSSTKETPEPDFSSGMTIAIILPLVIILIIVVIILLIIVKIRRNKLKSESDSENNHSSATGGSGFAVPNDVDTGVYASIDNHAAAPGTAFGNQAYQTVIGTQTRGSYAIVDDGAVYYSTVAGNGTQNGALELPTNTYEQVTLDVEVNEYDHIASDTLRTQRNDYDEVALEARRASEDNAIEVDNVLYGEN